MRSAPRLQASTVKTDKRPSGRSWRSEPHSSAGAEVADPAAQQAAIDEFLDLLRYERSGDAWLGRTPDWYGPVIFGGVGLALTISAACLDAPPGSRLHSLHAHFLRPVKGGTEITFRNEVVKRGRAFCLDAVTASQEGKSVIAMTCSFTADTDGVRV